MYLVAIFTFFEAWVLHEYIEKGDRYDDSILLLLVVFIVFFFISLGLIQFSASDVLNSYCNIRLLLQIPHSLFMDPYTTYSF